MLQKQFADIIQFIQQSRANAVRAVNTELINLYWNVGAYINKQLANAGWGEKTVDELAFFIQKNHPELKGFNRRGLYRMKQFYETYAAMPFVPSIKTQIQNAENERNTIVSPLRTQLSERNKKVSSTSTQIETSDIRNSILAKLSWTHHRVIFSRCRSDEEREFYLKLCIQENYSVRELERQINSSVFERTVIGNTQL